MCQVAASRLFFNFLYAPSSALHCAHALALLSTVTALPARVIGAARVAPTQDVAWCTERVPHALIAGQYVVPYPSRLRYHAT